MGCMPRQFSGHVPSCVGFSINHDEASAAPSGSKDKPKTAKNAKKEKEPKLPKAKAVLGSVLCRV